MNFVELCILLVLPTSIFGQYYDTVFFKRSDDYDQKQNEVEQYVLDNIKNGRFIGCKSINLCSQDRSCYDDKLFGTCVSNVESADFVYFLAPELKQILELAMADLYKENYRWNDFYTQCFLQSVIKSSELQKFLDVKHCKRNVFRKVTEDNLLEEDKTNGFKVPVELLETPLLSQQQQHQINDKYRRQMMSDQPSNDVASSDDGSDVFQSNRRSRSTTSEEHMNPLANSDNAISSSTVGYADAQKVRKELNIAKRKKSEWIWLTMNRNITAIERPELERSINEALQFPKDIENFQSFGASISFKLPLDATGMARNITDFFRMNRLILPRFTIVDVGSGFRLASGETSPLTDLNGENRAELKMIIIVCSVIFSCLVVVLIGFIIQKIRFRRDKLGEVINSKLSDHGPKNYADLFRVSSKENPSNYKSKQACGRLINTKQANNTEGPAVSSPGSTRSSTSSWTDDAPAVTNMDIYTGHMILSYMEKHLSDKKMFQSEWQSIVDYETDDNKTNIATNIDNATKNRFADKIPYDKSRVCLKAATNGDYINASYIVDHDPKVPVYIASQTPLANGIGDFWQMVWEQSTVVLVTLTGPNEVENFWPSSDQPIIYNCYEVNLVSEHVWSDEYLVRNFYLRNVKTSETRTVTQFHYLKWSHNQIPCSSKSILEFRRKVNKSYRSKSTPILIQCSDGCGRTGTYILLDLILNRISKGMKEMDILATLEHLRDQRMNLVNTEDQFGFVLNTISEEVNTILKVLNN